MSTDFGDFLAASAGLKSLEDDEKQTFSVAHDKLTNIRDAYIFGGMQGRRVTRHHYWKELTVTPGIAPFLAPPLLIEELVHDEAHDFSGPAHPKKFRDARVVFGSAASQKYSRKQKVYESTEQKVEQREPMTDSSTDDIKRLLSAIEERMDKRIERIEKETDRRGNDFRRELELRDEAFRREQAVRDAALDQRFSSFLAIQAERDKRLDDVVGAIRGEMTTVRTEVGRLGSLKLNIWGAMATALTIGIAIAALSIGFYQTGKSDAPPREQLSQAQQLPAPAPAPAPADSAGTASSNQ